MRSRHNGTGAMYEVLLERGIMRDYHHIQLWEIRRGSTETVASELGFEVLEGFPAEWHVEKGHYRWRE